MHKSYSVIPVNAPVVAQITSAVIDLNVVLPSVTS